MRRYCTIIIALALQACSESSGSSIQNPEPLRCMITLQKYIELSKASGDSSMEKNLSVHQWWYTEKVKGLDEDARTSREIDRISQEIASDENKSFATLETCLKSQEADSAFQAWVKQK
jgi:hypothetical protein